MLQISAQRQTDNWYFGKKAGISFRTGSPIPMYDGAFENWEGSAVMSDSLGNLHFYTNGVTVWNAAHDTMSNGDGLKGDYSSSQSALIVPLPNSSKIYYIFTTDDIIRVNDEVTHDGLKFSVVDMNGDNGLGAITLKNRTLRDSVSEKLTAVRHANGRDVWIISHEWNTDKFYSWLLTPTGIVSSPVITAVGTPHTHIETFFFINSIGYMKASPDGSKLALVLKRAMLAEIYDFNHATGVISNPMTLEMESSPYGIEFSPDLSKLYVSDDLDLYQFDLQAGTQTEIQNSRRKIYNAPHYIGAIQIAQDGKLYVAMHEQTWLGAINQPDSLGSKCDFQPKAVFLDGRICQLGLPNFIQSWFQTQPIRVQPGCVGEPTKFFTRPLTSSDSVRWQFDDPESGLQNTSSLSSPEHIYFQSGTYQVSLTNWFENYSQTFEYLFFTEPSPEISLGNDTTFCGQTQYLINAYKPHYEYFWHNNSTDSVFTANETGIVSVFVRDIYTGCTNSDTIKLVFAEIPEIELGNDTSFCENSEFKISAFYENYTYTWQDSSTDSVFITQDTGKFYVDIRDENNCTNSDTILLTHKLLPRFDLGNDTVICETESFYKKINLPANETDVWWILTSDSIYSFDYEFVEPDTAIVFAKNNCGLWVDTLNVGFHYCGEIIIPNVFTPDGSGQNETFYIKGIEELGCQLLIYNRWGNLVYETSDYNNDWNAENCEPGVYYYILNCKENNQNIHGFVHVFK